MWIQIRIRVKSWIRIRIIVKIQELLRLKMDPWRAWTLKMEAWMLRIQCCGSGSVIRCLFDPWIGIRDPE
jgi:hypothetical protein